MDQEPGAEMVENTPDKGFQGPLSAFNARTIEQIRNRIGDTPDERWPNVDGCLVVLFTARSGSTFLTRELEVAYDIGHVSESLNPPKLLKRSPQKIVRKLRSSWFAFKAGAQGVIAAETCGLMAAYRERTCFIRLIRRDIVAQAVSTAKAIQTTSWHARNTPVKSAEYDEAMIDEAVGRISIGVEQLRQYAIATGRPHLQLVYEDFAYGDLEPAMRVGDELGLPRRPPDDKALRPVERVGDEVNAAWIARFNEEMSPATRAIVEYYVANATN